MRVSDVDFLLDGTVREQYRVVGCGVYGATKLQSAQRRRDGAVEILKQQKQLLTDEGEEHRLTNVSGDKKGPG